MSMHSIQGPKMLTTRTRERRSEERTEQMGVDQEHHWNWMKTAVFEGVLHIRYSYR